MTENKVFTAKVCWFSPKTGIGFVTPDDPSANGGKDLFVHWSNIEMSGYKTLKPGQIVSFEIGKNERGPQAIHIKILKDVPSRTDADDEAEFE